MFGVAILGYGVVGSGVAEAVRLNSSLICQKTGEEVRVVKILDLLDFPDSPDAELIVHDIDEILKDDKIKIVVETMGGIRAAYTFTKMALQHQKHVVTSNKELVAEYGSELLKLAEDYHVRFLFEASVGGGIPIIRPIKQCLIADDIIEILGILNGTTNYILTYMKNAQADFSESLKDAQLKGYAEKEPSADVDGLDASRKIAILSMVAYGHYVDWSQIHTEGISKINQVDLAHAHNLGKVIKLIAKSRRCENAVEAFVAPMLINKNHIFASVDDVYNSISVEGNIVGNVLFYGRGAGKLPTASAVVADIVDILQDQQSGKSYGWDAEKTMDIRAFEESSYQYYFRAATEQNEQFTKIVFREFPDATLLPQLSGQPENSISFTIPQMKEKFFQDKIAKVLNAVSESEISSIIRYLS